MLLCFIKTWAYSIPEWTFRGRGTGSWRSNPCHFIASCCWWDIPSDYQHSDTGYLKSQKSFKPFFRRSQYCCMYKRQSIDFQHPFRLLEESLSDNCTCFLQSLLDWMSAWHNLQVCATQPSSFVPTNTSTRDCSSTGNSVKSANPMVPDDSFPLPEDAELRVVDAIWQWWEVSRCKPKRRSFSLCTTLCSCAV